MTLNDKHLVVKVNGILPVWNREAVYDDYTNTTVANVLKQRLDSHVERLHYLVGKPIEEKVEGIRNVMNESGQILAGGIFPTTKQIQWLEKFCRQYNATRDLDEAKSGWRFVGNDEELVDNLYQKDEAAIITAGLNQFASDLKCVSLIPERTEEIKPEYRDDSLMHAAVWLSNRGANRDIVLNTISMIEDKVRYQGVDEFEKYVKNERE